MTEIGLFPLGIVLLPTELVPLHIFEDRYKELIGECLELGQEFGLVYADEDGVRETGTRARVTEVLEHFDDGRLNIAVEGTERFQVTKLTRGRSFMTAEVEEIEDEPAEPDSEAIARALASYPRARRGGRGGAGGAGRELAAARLRARRERRARPGVEAGAARAPLGTGASRPPRRPARGGARRAPRSP